MGWLNIEAWRSLRKQEGLTPELAAERLKGSALSHRERVGVADMVKVETWKTTNADRLAEAREWMAGRAMPPRAQANSPRTTTSQRKGPVAEHTIQRVDFATLKNGPPPARPWVVSEWLPQGAVTLLSGRGGHGKSLLAQQLAIAVAAGAPWFDNATTRGRVLGIFCEDDADEMLRRGHALLAATGTALDDVAKHLHLDARAGKPNTLMTFGTDHVGKPTALMAELRRQCEAVMPVLVILDNAAQLFAGQENARAEVTAFCNELTGLARQYNCAVLLLGHTAKMEGSEYSGSTAWDAAVRSRLLLERRDDGTTVLAKLKANYSGLDELKLFYRSGCFIPLPTGADVPAEDMLAAREAIATAVRTFTGRRQAVSHVSTARNYLVKAMQHHKLDGGHHEATLRTALDAMLDDSTLTPDSVLWKDRWRHDVHGLVIGQGSQ